MCPEAGRQTSKNPAIGCAISPMLQPGAPEPLETSLGPHGRLSFNLARGEERHLHLHLAGKPLVVGEAEVLEVDEAGRVGTVARP